MHDLDTLLALQLAVAWAGESDRLGWWRTTLLDPDTGLDVLDYDLGLHTPHWAAFQVARLAACQADRTARVQHAEPDQLCSLFHWGFTVDEQLEDRLRELKRESQPPQTALPLLAELTSQDWDPERTTQALAALGSPQVRKTPTGRRIQPGPTPRDTALALAAALVPLTPGQYPLVFSVGLPA